MGKASQSMVRQFGQSMVEYSIVTSALFFSIFVANEGCPEYDNCIQALQVAMHDNYRGYSASISAVQRYGEFEADVEDSNWQTGPGSGGSGGSSGSVNPNAANYLTSQSVLTSGGSSIGQVAGDGVTVLNEDGFEIGSYDRGSSTFTDLSGGRQTATVNDIVFDDEGNRVYLNAVYNCASPPTQPTVVGFVYPHSTEDELYFSSSTKDPIEIGSAFCFAPAFGVVTTDGKPGGGSIVNGVFYADNTTFSTLAAGAKEPVGEVVYLNDGSDSCIVIANGWDDDVDYSGTDQEIYDAQLELLTDTSSDSAIIGYLDNEDYLAQIIGGANSSPNDCVSRQTIEPPP